MNAYTYKKINYVIRMPENFVDTKKYPVVIYIHGAGSRGSDIDLLKNHTFFKETEERLKDVVAVAPQCYENSWFTIFEQLLQFIKHIIKKKYVDKKKVYLVGASMGAYTTWQLAMSRPELFAAIIPICGGGMYWNASRLIDMDIWAFHGDQDPTVFCEESKKMVDAINNKGGHAKLTIYNGCEHDSWTRTFQNNSVWDWLLSKKLKRKKS